MSILQPQQIGMATETAVTITQAFDALKWHRANSGSIFSVVFTKANGERREMVCRFGVKSHLRGGEWANGNAGKPEDHFLAIVFDMQKQGYRSIPVRRMHQIKLDGTVYEVIS